MNYSNEFTKELNNQMNEFGVSPTAQKRVNESIEYLNSDTIKTCIERSEVEDKKYTDAWKAVEDMVLFLDEKNGEALEAEIEEMYIATNYTFVKADATITWVNDYRVYYKGEPVYNRETNEQLIVNALSETQAAKIYQNFLNELKNEKCEKTTRG